MAKTRRRVGRPRSGLARVKFFVRAAPEDVERFRALGPALSASEDRRVTDAEVFRLAVRALVATLPPDVRRRL
jgi:hypothetical protein